MQKLKLYVTETVRERRELTREEHLIHKAYYGNTDHKMPFLDYLNDIGYLGGYASDEGTFGSASFETKTEREATTDEYLAYYAKEAFLLSGGDIVPAWIDEQIGNIEFRLEVVDE